MTKVIIENPWNLSQIEISTPDTQPAELPFYLFPATFIMIHSFLYK